VDRYVLHLDNLSAGSYVITAVAKAPDAEVLSNPVRIFVLKPFESGNYMRGGLTGSLPRASWGRAVSVDQQCAFPLPAGLVKLATAFETPSQLGENYGTRLSGYIIPPKRVHTCFTLHQMTRAPLPQHERSACNKTLIAWNRI